MEIPNLPTDNLYKFMAISGVTIAIVGFLMSYYGYRDSITELDKIHTEYCLLDFEIKNLKSLDSLISNEINDIKSELIKYGNLDDNIKEKIEIDEIKKYYSVPKNRDLYVFLHTYKSELFPEFKKYEEIKQKETKKDELEQNIKRNEILLKERYRIWKDTKNQINKLNWMWVIFTGLGTYIAINGFILWYKKVQKYLDEEIKDKSNKLKNL
jgi:hypothetical protein